jgi:hypothetical protein
VAGVPRDLSALIGAPAEIRHSGSTIRSVGPDDVITAGYAAITFNNDFAGPDGSITRSQLLPTTGKYGAFPLFTPFSKP